MATVNSLLNFIKSFVQWRENNKSFDFQIISQHQYRDGLLLRVNRESVTNRANSAQVSTHIWVPNNKNFPYLYIFLDNLETFSVRNLSHRIQIFSSDRHLEGESVKTNIHLSESYYLGTHAQANSIILKLIFYCRDRNYSTVDWNWEINTARKQLLVFDYTEFTQEAARESNRYVLDRYEMRFSIPRNVDPALLDKITDIVSPKPDPPKSRVLEILIIGAVVIAIAWLWVSR